MPTGPKHFRFYEEMDHDGNVTEVCEECRCMEGDDHTDGIGLSVHDAADIWGSSGMDEDYSFGFSADELRSALDDQ